MRVLGYSTGALSPGDVPRALSMLAGRGAQAVELSALRIGELRPLLDLIPTLDLSAYRYVSVHAPSRFSAAEEPGVVEAIAAGVPESWPVVLHPDTIHDPRAWRALGARLSIENMDRRKAWGRTAAELSRIFEALPEAAFCFDVGHAHQVDRTMSDAWALLSALGARLGQVHVSEVTSAGRHDPVSRPAAAAFRKIAAWVPEGVPLIMESPAEAGAIAAEMRLAGEALAAPNLGRMSG